MVYYCGYGNDDICDSTDDEEGTINNTQWKCVELLILTYSLYISTKVQYVVYHQLWRYAYLN